MTVYKATGHSRQTTDSRIHVGSQRDDDDVHIVVHTAQITSTSLLFLISEKLKF